MKLIGPAKAKKGKAAEAAEAGLSRTPKDGVADIDVKSESDYYHDGMIDMSTWYLWA